MEAIGSKTTTFKLCVSQYTSVTGISEINYHVNQPVIKGWSGEKLNWDEENEWFFGQQSFCLFYI